MKYYHLGVELHSKIFFLLELDELEQGQFFIFFLFIEKTIEMIAI